MLIFVFKTLYEHFFPFLIVAIGRELAAVPLCPLLIPSWVNIHVFGLGILIHCNHSSPVRKYAAENVVKVGIEQFLATHITISFLLCGLYSVHVR